MEVDDGTFDGVLLLLLYVCYMGWQMGGTNCLFFARCRMEICWLKLRGSRAFDGSEVKATKTIYRGAYTVPQATESGFSYFV